MSQWDKKYVSTNVKKNARPYSNDLFLKLHSELVSCQSQLQPVACTLIVCQVSLLTFPSVSTPR